MDRQYIYIDSFLLMRYNVVTVLSTPDKIMIGIYIIHIHNLYYTV